MSGDFTQDKRQHILSAAEKLIAHSGLHTFSMHKLASEAEVATGTLYRYFDDKEHLLNEMRLAITQRIAEAVQANITNSMPPKKRYRQMWLNIWHLAASDSDALLNRVQYESLPLAQCKQVRAHERKLFAQVAHLFDQGKQLGLIKPLDNEVLSSLSFEVCVSLARKHALGLHQLDDQALDAAIEATWDAITTQELEF